MSSVIHAPQLTRKTGLGTVVEAIAKPLAKRIDRMTRPLPKPLRTNLAECGGCKHRRDALNGIVPDVRHPFAKD